MTDEELAKRGIKLAGYLPGALAETVRLHMEYYAPQWNFGVAFETKVASEMAEFLGRLDADRDLFLTAHNDQGDMLGSITIDAEEVDSEGAHLRWFITSDAARGTGLGRALMSRAIQFCDQCGYDRIYLTTFAGLEAARHLYESFGFVMVSESAVDQWQGGVREQRFERAL
ncbi:MAG: GNAT family N-acetyltransferase [Pseudomonadota bacterium]